MWIPVSSVETCTKQIMERAIEFTEFCTFATFNDYFRFERIRTDLTVYFDDIDLVWILKIQINDANNKLVIPHEMWFGFEMFFRQFMSFEAIEWNITWSKSRTCMWANSSIVSTMRIHQKSIFRLCSATHMCHVMLINNRYIYLAYLSVIHPCQHLCLLFQRVYMCQFAFYGIIYIEKSLAVIWFIYTHTHAHIHAKLLR